MSWTIVADEPGQFDAGTAKRLLGERRLGLDMEYTGGGIYAADAACRLVQFATETHAVVLDLRDRAQEAFARDMLTDESRILVAHNAAGAEIPAVLRAFDVDISARTYDTLTVALLIYPGNTREHGLKTFADDLSRDGLGTALLDAETALHGAFRELWLRAHKHGSAEEISTYGYTHIPARDPRYLRYAGLDALAVRRLAPVLAERARVHGVYACIPFEQRVNASGARMAARGMQTRPTEITRLLDTIGAENERAKSEFESAYQVKALSAVRRAEVVREQGVQFRVFTDKGHPKLSKEVLRELHAEYPDSHAVATLLRVAETSNVTTFLRALNEFRDRQDRVHPSIRTLGAVSGRWTVARPALATVSGTSGSRHAFGSRHGDQGVLVSVDLGQIEPRVAFELSGCRSLISLCQTGVDPYAAAATMVFGGSYTPKQRKVAKRIVLGSLFEAGVSTLYRQAKYTDGILDISEQAISVARQKFNSSVPEIKRTSKWLQRQSDVRLPSGRFVPHDPLRLYRAINSFTQGPARDFLMALVLDVEAAGLGEYMIMTFHDEILLDLPAHLLATAVPALREIFTQGYGSVPTTCDVEVFDRHWAGCGVAWEDYQRGVRQNAS